MTYKQENKGLPPLDPDVKIPAAIRAAALRANELHAEVYTPDAQPGAEPPEKAVQGQEPPGDTGEPPKPETPPPAPADGGEPPSGREQSSSDGTDDWEHKYKSVKPRFDKQEDTIRQLNHRINQLERTLASTAQASTAEARRERRNPDLNFKPLDKDEREAYGDDFIDVAARAAQEKITPEISNLRQELEELKEQNEVQTRRNMYNFLTDNLPSWRTINRNPKFIAWCNLPDPFSGAIRMGMLSDAFARGDAPRVLRFFNGFLTDEAATAPAEYQPETPRLPGNGQVNGKVPLETFAAPGRAKAPAGSEPPEEKETITAAQIAHFYMLVQKGHYRGNEAEKNRLERMIFDAQADGRVV